MGRKAKYTKETKIKVVNEYIKGIKSIGDIAYELGCCKETVRGWVMMFKECGEEVFNDKPHNKSYTKEFKETVIKEYFEGKGSITDLRVKYKILGYDTLRRWILKYNNGIILSDYKPMSEVYTMKSRKVSYEERIEIVNYCMSNDYDYKSTANKYNVPYSQVYTWVKKVKENGYGALEPQKKGPKPKNIIQPKTPEDILELENERLRRENERLQIELEVLKKKHRLKKRANTQRLN